MKVTVDWDRTLLVSNTTASMQVIPNARARRGRALHDVTYGAIRKLGARFTRYLPWGPYPRLQIAELHPPTPTETFWDFTHIDPELIDFLEATKDRDPIINFSSIPPWMFEQTAPTSYSEDPDQMRWGAANHASWPPKLVDPTGRQLAEYYARIVSWYVKGGFTDENGVYHHSGHAFELPWWGVLNEHEYLGAEIYTVLYDAIVTEVRKVSPTTRFVAMELSGIPLPDRAAPEFIEYFLDRKNHAPDIPIDMIAYHFYAYGRGDQATSLESWQYSFFDQADGMLAQAQYIDCLRKRLSPNTLTYPTELGSMVPSDMDTSAAAEGSSPPFPAAYWTLSAALFAYLYIGFARLGIEVVGQAGFSFYPGNFAGVSMVDWNTGELNARYHVLELLNDNFAPGDMLTSTEIGRFASFDDVLAQAFETSRGRKMLLVNKRAYPVQVELDEPVMLIGVVDDATDAASLPLAVPPGESVTLQPFAVAVLAVGAASGNE